MIVARSPVRTAWSSALRTNASAPNIETRSAAEVLDSAYAGEDCVVVSDDGTAASLAIERWQADADDADHALFVRPCSGDVLDVGCGPGRLTLAFADEGRRSLGIDTSHEAVRQAKARGANAHRRNVFHRLPAQWDHVVLADGNIGIGGDPARLLRRCARIAGGGRVLVEVAAEGGVELRRLRLLLGNARSEPFAWASVGLEGIGALAASSGLRVEGVASAAGRHVATLVSEGRDR